MGKKKIKSLDERISEIYLWKMGCEGLAFKKEYPYKRDKKRFDAVKAQRASANKTWEYLLKKMEDGEKIDREFLVNHMETMNVIDEGISNGAWNYSDRTELLSQK